MLEREIKKTLPFEAFSEVLLVEEPQFKGHSELKNIEPEQEQSSLNPGI